MALGVGGGRGAGSGHGVPLQDPPAVLQHDARAAVVVVVQQHALPVALAVLPSALFELPDEQFISVHVVHGAQQGPGRPKTNKQSVFSWEYFVVERWTK